MTTFGPTYPPWNPPGRELALERHQVHAWRASLNRESSQVEQFWSLLSEDERLRAERFRFQKDRDHYIVGRGLLRTILGRYLHQEPEQLRFCYSPYDKPSLAPEFGGDTLSFNLSHAHGLAIYAVTWHRRIGVDLEYLDSKAFEDGIAERFFSQSEVEALYSLPAEAREAAFFTCWTRKEAFIKAVGEGLSIPLDQFEVSLKPGEPAALLRTSGDPHEAARWSMQELHPGSNFKGALCVEGHDWQLECWQWPEL